MMLFYLNYFVLNITESSETGSGSVDKVQLSRLLLEGGYKIRSPKRFEIKIDETMGSIRKSRKCIVRLFEASKSL